VRRLLLITLLLAASTAAYSEVGTANCVLKIDGKLLVNERTPCAVRFVANGRGVILQTRKYQAGVEAGLAGDEQGLVWDAYWDAYWNAGNGNIALRFRLGRVKREGDCFANSRLEFCTYDFKEKP
jgi:hypothetical protein